METWHKQYLHEIQQGFTARASNNEGRARVCARRAASILVSEYLTLHQIPLTSSSAYDRLRLMASQPDLSPTAYQIVSHLLERVDTGFSLPPGIDLLADAQQLAKELSLL